MNADISYAWSFVIALAAVLRTYGDMSVTASLIPNIMIPEMIGTRMLDRTRNALALIS